MEIANEEKVGLDHIKFHGALHNDTAENRDLALLLVKAIKEEFPQTPLFVPPKSEIEQVALELNHPIKREVFGDRAYQTNYKLVSRTLENSLFTQCKQVISHLESIIEKGQIQTSSGERIPVEADTICIHGDNPGILGFLPTVRKQFWK
ncbi:LamB/YcsF family protein [Algoriphagus boritolerans]|uniref:LamB/YcsF family protein n=1 Tax=Algoriphagus boritolerans TaxID=308111 RepID=UPI000B025C42